MGDPHSGPWRVVPSWWEFQERYSTVGAPVGSATPPIQLPRTAKCC
jgi:hypothetical protein